MIPRRQQSLETEDELPFGMTHPNGTPCPLADAKVPVGFLKTCCSFNVKAAAESLFTFGHDALARLLLEGLACERLPDLVKDLRRAADEVEAKWVTPMDTYYDPQLGGLSAEIPARFHPCLRPWFEAELASIRQAADWYEKVGRLGFGVRAWY